MSNGNHEINELERRFYETMTAYFSNRFIPTGFFETVGLIRGDLMELNQGLRESSESSERLTRALNRLTFWGVVVAGIGVATAVVSLIFEIYKYLNPVVN